MVWLFLRSTFGHPCPLDGAVTTKSRGLPWVFPVDFRFSLACPPQTVFADAYTASARAQAGTPWRAAELRPEPLPAQPRPQLSFLPVRTETLVRGTLVGGKASVPLSTMGPRIAFFEEEMTMTLFFEIKNIKLTHNSHTVEHSDLNYNTQSVWVGARLLSRKWSSLLFQSILPPATTA